MTQATDQPPGKAEIERITGKFKLGQNLPSRLRASVADKLEQRGHPIDRATAELMLSCRLRT